MTATRIFDLHSHSSASDGILSPEALVSRARVNKVTSLALTDHDSVAGIARAQRAAVSEGVALVPGIEYSSQWREQGIHIVGLHIDPLSLSTKTAVEHQSGLRGQRAQEIDRRLASKCGIEGALTGAMRHCNGGSIGRPHFARYLVENGHARDMNQAFKKYLGAGKICDSRVSWPDFSTVVDWIKRAGGVAVLAHPAKYKMTRTKLCAMVRDFVEAGGEAMEVICGSQTPERTRDLQCIADKFALKSSCGSDFHGPGPWQELGSFGSLPAGASPVWEIWEKDLPV